MSVFNNCTVTVSDGGTFNSVQGNMYAVSDDTSYTMNGSHNRSSNRNTGTKNIFGISQSNPEGHGGFAPNQYPAPPNPQYGDPNAQFPEYRQPAPNLNRSVTEPGMNPRSHYNPQNRQYAPANAPVFDAANGQAEFPASHGKCSIPGPVPPTLN
ncbi:hypothetical protein MSAN_01666300 [Mycena sanguinolenta]|uniref:Uncharacterized protein n=1 Tax=Mycena sanguinolenta TaxID=230812 RepID=A0A8H7CUR7_9AGAR|nr:hypothetical protein MSAN_01666300 [Mycena sanguinolenta]